jgi:hypothetical protein
MVPHGTDDHGPRRVARTLEKVRMTVFRRLMAQEFGRVRAEMLAADHVLGELGTRTVNEAIEAGEDPKDVWKAVCEAFDIPLERR